MTASLPAKPGAPVQNQPQPTMPFIDLRLFQETSGIEPFFPPALYVDGFAELQRGNLPRAIELFRQGVMRDPLVAESGVESGALGRAATALRDGSLDRAAEYVAVAIELAPDRAEPHRIQGLIHLAGRQLDAAAAALDCRDHVEPARRALASRAGRRADHRRQSSSGQRVTAGAPQASFPHPAARDTSSDWSTSGRACTPTRCASSPRPPPRSRCSASTACIRRIGALARSQQQYDAAIDGILAAGRSRSE